jgi:hypothetical protein
MLIMRTTVLTCESCTDDTTSESITFSSEEDDSESNQSVQSCGLQKLEKPHILKNDIRRYYSLMYMNTMNSADFTHIQNYLHTFMTGRCTFQVDYQSDYRLNMPPIVASASPRMFAHFLLGTGVMFPDMVTYFRSTKLITSPAWTGTKVVMEVETPGTKVCELPVSAWLPACEDQPVSVGNSPVATPDSKGQRKRKKAATWSIGNPAHISTDYMDSLYMQATPLATPIPTITTGILTMILDENCYIQHMRVSVQQRVVRDEV